MCEECYYLNVLGTKKLHFLGDGGDKIINITNENKVIFWKGFTEKNRILISRCGASQGPYLAYSILHMRHLHL